mgnify:CR=1 FL=1
MFFIAICAAVYLMVGFLVCRKEEWYEGSFSGGLFEGLFYHGEIKPIVADFVRCILLTVFWPIAWLIFQAMVLVFSAVDPELFDSEKPEEPKKEEDDFLLHSSSEKL